MKPINKNELEFVVEEMQGLTGAEFQNVSFYEGVVTLSFWKEKPLWVSVSVMKGVPFCILIQRKELWPKGWFKKSPEKPITSFLKAHFLREKILKISQLKSFGRVLLFEFESGLSLEARIFPGGANFGAFKDTKKVFLKKPQTLEAKEDHYVVDMVRSPEVIRAEILDDLSESVKKQPEKEALSKVSIAKSKILEAIKFLETDPYFRFSETLKAKADLPVDLQSFYNSKISESENIEWGYRQHKKKEVKILRLTSRLKNLSEVGLLSSRKDLKSKPLDRTVEKSYFLKISNDLAGRCGRSAKDNAQLLRGAKPWHLWMHLKDFPSGHLLITKPKHYNLSELELQRFGLFLFSKGAPKKLFASDQLKFEVIFTECRHVRPIKGAKPGLVQALKTASRVYTWSEKIFYSF